MGQVSFIDGHIDNDEPKIPNNFINVLNTLKDTIPKLELTHSLWYVIKGNSDYQIKVAMPDPFDNYQDIVARITLFYKENILWDILIATDTDLKLFQQKFLQKIQKHMSTNKGV